MHFRLTKHTAALIGCLLLLIAASSTLAQVPPPLGGEPPVAATAVPTVPSVELPPVGDPLPQAQPQHAPLVANPTGPILTVNGTTGTVQTGNPCPNPRTSAVYKQVQAAIDCALADDTIQINGGVYTEHLTISQSLTLQGVGAPILSGGNAGRVLLLTDPSTVTLNALTLTNGSTDLGGAIYSPASTVILNQTTVSGSHATQNGGAIYTLGGSVTLNQSTLSGNTATNSGGGIYTQSGTVTVNNSTLASNTATNGGGIFTQAGTVALTNATIASNTATQGSNLNTVVGAVTLSNTIVAQGVTGANCVGTITSNGFNLESANSCHLTAPSDHINTNPLLAALADNGGPTQTLALQTGSLAIDHGNNTVCLAAPINSVDQRGVLRPQIPLCDIGAYEFGGSLNLIQNGDFSNGLTSWSTFGGQVHQLVGGVFQFYGTSSNPQGVIFQNTGVALAANAPIEATIQLGNSSSIRKRALFILNDNDFSDLQVCNFWLPPNSPLHTYTMQTFTTKAWTAATLSVYAASNDSTGWYLIDNATLTPKPGLDITTTKCFDPLTPAPGNGGDGSNLLVNPGFGSALTPWNTFGQITYQLTGGVFQFYGATGLLPRATVFQYTNTAEPLGMTLEASIQLGNSSAIRKRALLLVSDADFSDMSVCSFWIPPSTALQSYTIRVYVTDPWTNATFSIYAAKGDNTQWLLVDNGSLVARPSVSVSGEECYYPGAVLPVAPLGVRVAPELPTAVAPASLPPALDVVPNSETQNPQIEPTHEVVPVDSGLDAPPPGG